MRRSLRAACSGASHPQPRTACTCRYNPESTATWTKEIADEIKSRLKSELELPRYKFVVQVCDARVPGEMPAPLTPPHRDRRSSSASSGGRACAWAADASGTPTLTDTLKTHIATCALPTAPQPAATLDCRAPPVACCVADRRTLCPQDSLFCVAAAFGSYLY